MHVKIRINGKPYEKDIDPRLLLTHFIRDLAGLTGTHIGCETSICGACTVLANGLAVKSCTMFAVQADGVDVVTIEGTGIKAGIIKVANDMGILHSGHDHVRAPTARAQHGTNRYRNSGRTRRQSVPLHRISKHRRCRPFRCGQVEAGTQDRRR